MQLDPATRSGQPFLHEFGVMIARVVQEYVDADHQRIERFQRFQQPDRRYRVDRFGFDMRVWPVSRSIAPWMLMRSRPLVCSIASFCSFGAQQPTGRAAWVGCTASTNIATSSSPLEFNRSS